MGRPAKRVNQYKVIRGFIPVEVDWEVMNRIEPIGANSIAGLEYILSYMISYKRISSKKKKPAGVPISARELRYVLSQASTSHLNYLLRAEIIVLVKNLSRHGQSRQFDFPFWFSGKTKPITITDFNICVREQRRLKRNSQEAKLRYPYLTKWFNASLKCRESDFGVDPHSKHECTNESNFELACIHSAKMKLIDGHFLMSCDDYSGRLHTNLTNLKTEVRTNLYYKDEEGRENHLVSMDLKNSQFYFLSYFIALITQNDYKQILQNIFKYSNRKKSDQVQRILTEMGSIYNLEDDALKFGCIASSGQIYEHFRGLLLSNKFFRKDNMVADRKMAKDLLIHLLFSRKNSKNKEITAIRPIFQAEWPSLYSFLYRIKVDSKVLPLILQSIERHLILDIIAKEFSMLKPEAPLFSIHDSLITTEQHSEYLFKYFEKRLTELTGINPTLSKDLWKLP